MGILNITRRIVAVGGVTCDSTSYFNDHAKLGDFKARATSRENSLGGGAGNFVEAQLALSSVFKIPVHITLGTKIGTPPPLTKPFEELDMDDIDLVRAHLAYKFVVKRLQAMGIEVIDTLNGRENSIPHNLILSPRQQRFIELAQENQRVYEFDSAVDEKMRAAVASADLVYGHTSVPLQSLMAFSAPRREDVPTLLDYSVTKWENAELNRYEDLLRKTTHVKMGSDVTLPGLEQFEQHKHNEPAAHERRADQIIEIMRERYGIEHIAVSNNSLPVHVWDEGKRYVIPVEHVEPAYLLGVGDAAMSMTSLSMTQGQSYVQAVAHGTQIATESARRPGRTWLEHVTPQSITAWIPPDDDDREPNRGAHDSIGVGPV